MGPARAAVRPPTGREAARQNRGHGCFGHKASFPLAVSLVVLGMTSLAERLVPDELWELFRRVVPETVVVRAQGGGRRRAGDRECLAAIVFVATSGCSWRQLPPVFGPAWPTVYRRFARWSKDRVWARLHRVILDELGAQGELDWSRFAADSVSFRALKGGN
jgi:transposase